MEDATNMPDKEEAEGLENTGAITSSSSSCIYRRSVHFRTPARKRAKKAIFKTVAETYLRRDLGFGFVAVNSDSSNSNSNSNDHEERIFGDNQRHVTTEDDHNNADQLASFRRERQAHQTTSAQVVATVEELLSRLQSDNNKNDTTLVVCDADVLVHSLDLLEQAQTLDNVVVMRNLVIPQSALEQCRSTRHVSYDRTLDLWRRTNSNSTDVTCCNVFFPDTRHAETACIQKKPSPKEKDDDNDEAALTSVRVRRVAAYFGRHLAGSRVRVVLLTDNSASRQAARLEQPNSTLYTAYSVQEWVQELERSHPGLNLSDLVAQHDGVSSTRGDETTTTTTLWTAHLPSDELLRGLQQGLYYRGVFRQSNNSSTSGMVMIRRDDERVAVTMSTLADANRAIDGDVVVVKLYPVEEWIGGVASRNSNQKNENYKDQTDETSTAVTGIASETAEPSQADMENVPEQVSLEPETTPLRPTGKIVGIVRRNFASYSGSVYETTTTATSNKRSAKHLSRNTDSNLDWTTLDQHQEIAARHERAHADGSFTCVFFPVDQKVPPILMRTTQSERLLGQRLVVAMDSWPVHSPYPLGHYVRTLGPAGSKDVETQVLLKEHDIPHDAFSAAVLACLPPADYKLPTILIPTTLAIPAWTCVTCLSCPLIHRAARTLTTPCIV